MKASILYSSYVVNFLNEDLKSNEIIALVKPEIDEIAGTIEDESLKNWEVQFLFIYNNVKEILIYTKDKSYPKEKYKEITIHIPIPTKDIVSWGVNKDQHIYESNHLDRIIKNFNCLAVDLSQFKNKEDYISDCMSRAIKYCFEKGFTINGTKVKIK